MKIVQSFTVVSWTAHVMEQDARQNAKPYRVRLDHPGGMLTDWPILCDNGLIAYDTWGIPENGTDATKQAYQWIADQAE